MEYTYFRSFAMLGMGTYRLCFAAYRFRRFKDPPYVGKQSLTAVTKLNILIHDTRFDCYARFIRICLCIRVILSTELLGIRCDTPISV